MNTGHVTSKATSFILKVPPTAIVGGKKILTFRPRPQEQHHLSLVAEVSRRLPLRLVFDTLDSAKLVGVTEYDVSQTTLNEVLLSFLSFICVTGFFMHCRTSSWGNIVLVMDRRQISTFEYSHLTDSFN